MRFTETIGVALCGALVLGSGSAAQVDRRPPSYDKVGVNIALQVGGTSYEFAGRASCTNMAKAMHYGVIGQKWQVVQSDGSRSVILNFLRPAKGTGDMFSLSVTSGKTSHDVDTVKGKGTDPVKGSGSVRLATAGGGGTFTIAATADDGAKISGTIKCDAFTTPPEVAGH